MLGRGLLGIEWNDDAGTCTLVALPPAFPLIRQVENQIIQIEDCHRREGTVDHVYFSKGIKLYFVVIRDIIRSLQYLGCE